MQGRWYVESLYYVSYLLFQNGDLHEAVSFARRIVLPSADDQAALSISDMAIGGEPSEKDLNQIENSVNPSHIEDLTNQSNVIGFTNR